MIDRPLARQQPSPNDRALRGAVPWWQSTLALALAGSLLLWAAFPPLAFAPLAWFAPVPWVLLIRRHELTGKRPYVNLWLAGFAFWLAVLHWLRLPHWATSFGWLALSCYLAFYLPAFVALSRVAVHTLRVSPLVAAPIVWTGLELARAYILGGFAMVSLSHTQYRWPELIQISDLFGSYGISFAIVFVAACVSSMLSWGGTRRAWWPVLPAAAMLIAVLAYGHWRMSAAPTEPGPRVALIQGSIDIEMKYDPEQGPRIFKQYFGLSEQAVRDHADLDLIVWPETMFRDPWYVFDKDFEPPAGAHRTPSDYEADSRRALQYTVAPLHTPCLIGIDTVHFFKDRIDHYNTALLTDRDGNVTGRYDKCLLVAFGEYVPLAESFPWLYRLTPLPGGSKAGPGPESFQIGQARYAPNICYENTIPQLIRSQVLELRSQEREPDILVNLTNDGWFWGSSELDLHLACAIFRAVECHKPFLIAANTGFSAWVDSSGQILAQAKRRDTDVIIATATIDRRGSWYLDHGDILGAVCLAASGGLAIAGLRKRQRERKNPSVSSS